MITEISSELFSAQEFFLHFCAQEQLHERQTISSASRLKLRNFWSDEARLPGTTLERLVEVLRALYSTTSEIQV